MPEQSTRVRFAAAYDRRSPLMSFAMRIAFALGIVGVNWFIVAIEADSYNDSYDGDLSVVDALYYTTVTLTTTGYGDITPITPGARLVNALVVTPLRLIFVVLLVGTTLKALTRESREEFRLARWRRRMRDHVVVLGYGSKGRSAVRALREKGTPMSRIVVVDNNGATVAAAATEGFTAVHGPATDEAVLRQALVDRAATVIVALDRDDTAILATLCVRRLASDISIIAAASEAQSAELLRHSGANSVIVSAETAGRLLGLATDSPQTVEVVEDLLSFGSGLDIAQRPVTNAEVGLAPMDLAVPVLAVLRGPAKLHYDSVNAGPLQEGDLIVFVDSLAPRP